MLGQIYIILKTVRIASILYDSGFSHSLSFIRGVNF
jgi:hypothetical protein